MTGHGEKLTRKQDQAIAALIACPSILDAARQSGVAVETLYRWLKLEGFQAGYTAARRAVVQQAIVQLQGACGEAVETLRTVMRDPEAPASARVSAARTVLETAVKAVELEDLEQRLAALEAQSAERPS
jgi:hypothetical protein